MKKTLVNWGILPFDVEDFGNAPWVKLPMDENHHTLITIPKEIDF